VGIALRRAGYETLEAANGKEALALLDGERLHLIISDVNMPVMNGIEFVKALKQHPTSKFTPVVMLTTEGQDDMKQAGKAAGAKAWIVKPFNPPQLLDVVSKLILP
jgi:two-component system chemotaxis response regulator CheY